MKHKLFIVISKKGDGIIKILILGFAKIKYMPYLNFYLDQLNLKKNDIHLLYWNRDGEKEITPENVICHEFAYIMQDDVPKVNKLRGFAKYKKYAIALIHYEQPDFIIVLHSLPGVLVSKVLLGEFRKKFIFDYRDYTYENFYLYRKIIYRLISLSKATFISSEGFRQKLPAAENIYISHNLPADPLRRRLVAKHFVSATIRIGFWGFIRHEQLNRLIIYRLANDDRFELHYFGRKQAIANSIEAYANQLNANNVFFHGSYSPGEQDQFAKEIDIIHNIYSNTEAPSQLLAMTNKYYDGLIYRLPQLCMHGSYMGENVGNKGLGLVCNPENPQFADEIWQYYNTLDIIKFSDCCDKELARIISEYNDGKAMIQNAINDV